MPKICKLCTYPVFSKGLCVRHDRERRAVESQKSPKVARNAPKRSQIKKKFPKPTGEKSLFLEIWNERPHICVNCKTHLGDEPLAHYFSHIKPKGLYPELRLDKSNVEILCIPCHTAYGTQSKEKYEARARL
jgi:Bacteriophage Lambda NinG protein.